MPFSAIGLELWSMTDQIYFDNFLITDDETTATEFARASWLLKKEIELTKSSSSSDSVIDGLLKAANDKPWLWAIYLLIILVPIVLVAVFCFGGKSKASPVTDPAVAKKTDATTADVVEEPAQDESAPVDDENDDDDDDDDSVEKVGKEDLEKEDLEKEPESESASESPKKTQPVKRTRATRKD